MRDPGSHPKPLVSSLQHDEDMIELLGEYVAELPDRVRTLQDAVRRADTAAVRRFAHQTKGSAAGYGFAPISHIAGELEQALLPVDDQDPPLESVLGQVQALIDLCLAARFDNTQADRA